MNPLAARLRGALLAGRRRPGVRGSGAPVKRRSDGFEFAELREYAHGDDPRRIDWAATARAGALQTRVVFEDHALTLGAALDASASMWVGRTRSNYELAQRAAECWYDVALESDRCVRATAGGPVVPRMRGRSAARHCAQTADASGDSFDRTLEVALAAFPRDAQLLLISDFFDLDMLELRLRACAARFETIALVAGDPWHDGLPLGGFVRLRDAESGSVQRLFVGARQRGAYCAAVAERERGIVERLLDLGIASAVLRDGDPWDAFFEALGLRRRRSRT